MSKLQEFRDQYPQYSNVSDADLAAGLHKKYYAHIPFEDFSKQVGLTAASQPAVNQSAQPSAKLKQEAFAGGYFGNDPRLSGVFSDNRSLNKSVMTGKDGASTQPNPAASETLNRVLDDNKQVDTLQPGAKIVDGYRGILEVGAKRGYAGLGRVEAGAMKVLADVTGSDTLTNIANALNSRADEIESGTVLRGSPVEGFSPDSIVQDLPEAGANAISSVIQTAPALGAAALSGGSALPTIFATTGAQEYMQGRDAGLSPMQALARAVPMASFEVIGEKIGGIDKLTKALNAASTGNGFADLGMAMIASAVREQPGEQITTAGQFITDLSPTVGLNPNGTFNDYLKAAKDTALATALQGGAMGAGGMALNQLANKQIADTAQQNISNAQSADEAINSFNTITETLGASDVRPITQQPASAVDSGAVLTQPDINAGSPADINAQPVPELGNVNDMGSGQGIASDVPVGVGTGQQFADLTDPILADALKTATNIDSVSDMPVAEQTVAPTKEDISGDRLNDEWVAFSPESGSLGIPRSDMPQIKAEHRGPMVNFLEARGITHDDVEVPASELKPTQMEYSTKKVDDAKNYEGGNRSILISQDGHVLDGHHQWLASLDKNEPVKAIRLNAPIRQLIDTVKEFPSAETSDQSAEVVPPQEQAESAPETQTDQIVAPETEVSSIAPTELEANTNPAVNQEREGVRPLVDAITRRRAAANQLGRMKAFDDYLGAAKDFLSGKDVKPTRFALAAKSFINDKPLNELFTQLAEMAKAPARQARAQTTNTVEQFTQRIDEANTVEQLREIAREIQQSGLSDAKVEALDNQAMDRMDALDSEGESENLIADDSNMVGTEDKNQFVDDNKKVDNEIQNQVRGATQMVESNDGKEPDASTEAIAANKQAKESKPVQEKVEDFGEKIGGAKKDIWTGYKDKVQASLSENIAAVPLSKSWPEPDYQALIDNGANAMTVAYLHAARDAVPTKPKSPWKVRAWAEKVASLRDLSYDMLNQNDASAEVLFKKGQSIPAVRGIFDIAELYFRVGHEKSLKGIRVDVGSYSVYNGIHYSPAKTIWSVEKDSSATSYSNWPKTFATGDTKEEVLSKFVKAFKDLEITEPAKRQVSFDIYSYRSTKQWTIGKKVGKNYIDLKTFDDLKEARAYRAQNHDELVELLNKAKEIPNERNAENNPRVGSDHRNGANVTAQIFAETFGFRGVEFGNYVENDKRQQDLNDAYDALMDMAGVLNIPTKAISLNGELGLAFGARGSGGKNPAKAHYESGHVVINLTKRAGAGSLGHEWWHAVDNYFARSRQSNSGFMTEESDVASASLGRNYIHRGEVRKEMVDAFGGVVKAIRTSSLKERSTVLDKTRSKNYWSTMLEMTARSFESYLIAKLQDQGVSNDYLANIVSEQAWGMEESYPYPTAGEIPAIREAYDNFFNVVEIRETDDGKTVLFSRADDSKTSPKFKRDVFFSLGAGELIELKTASDQSEAKVLNDALVEYGLGEDWKSAYETVDVPDTLLEFGKEIQTAFGRDVRFVAPTESKYDIFNGVQISQAKKALYVNARANVNITSIAGHELYHTMERTRPELHKWFKSQAAEYFVNFPEYKDKLNALVQDGEQKYGDNTATSELIADFTGDALSDPAFLQKLADNNPNKFQGLLRAVVNFLSRAVTELKNLGSSKYISDVESLRDKLAIVLDAYASGTPIEDAIERSDIGNIKFQRVWHGTPHRGIDRFSTDNIGTGEGAQAYGWGLYFASKKGIAEHYRKGLSYREIVKQFRDALPDEATIEDAMEAAENGELSKPMADVIEALNNDGWLGFDYPAQAITAAFKDIDNYDPSPELRSAVSNYGGQLYEVEIPEDNEMLSWDKAVPDEIIRKVAEKSVDDGLLDGDVDDAIDMLEGEYDRNGRLLYKGLSEQLGGDKNASMFLKDIGIRGIKYLDGTSRTKGDGTHNYVIFDGADTDIVGVQFSRKSNEKNNLGLDPESDLDAFIRKSQNDQVRWLRQVDAIKERGGKITDQNNVYQAMERMSARAMSRTEDFYDQTVKPVLEDMQKTGITLDELGEYMYALHAKERNFYIKGINPAFADSGYNEVGGSGMSDAEADEIVNRINGDEKAADYNRFTKQFRNWSEQNLNNLVEGGLLDAGQAAAMRQRFPNYVPLKGFETQDEVGGMLFQGAGFSNGKKLFQNALGRRSKADNPASYIIHSVAEGFLAKEKAHVGGYLERLIKDNPDDTLWTIDQPEKTPTLGKDGAGNPTVIEIDRGYDPDKEVRFIRDGKQVRIQLKDPLLARSYNNRGQSEIGAVSRMAASINSFLRQMWTQKNPVFPIVNMVRDIPSGMLYATGEGGFGLAGKLFTNLPGAWKTMWKQANGQSVKNEEWAKWLTEYRAAGGGIGYRMVSDIESTMDKIKSIEKELGGYSIIDAIAKGKYKEAVNRTLWKTYNNAVTDFIENINMAFENMTRLSIYRAARESGMSASEASRLSKNATVNFNRKGEETEHVRSWYLFANAAVQDVAKNKRSVVDAPHKNKVRAVLAGVAALGFAMGMLSDDDDDLEEENRNVNAVRFKVGNSMINIPLSYGLIGFMHYFGRSAAKALKGEDLSLQSLRLAGALFTNLIPINPVPNPDRPDVQNLIVGLTPTPFQFPIQVALNRNSFGSDMRPDYNDNPDAYKSFRGTRGSVYSFITEGLNEMTGGDKRKPGVIDVSPETLKAFIHFSLGGTGKFFADSASTASDVIDGGRFNPNKVPVLNRFASEQDVTTYRARFYRQAGEARDKLSLANKYRKDGNKEQFKEHRPWIVTGRTGNKLWKQMNELRDQELMAKDTLSGKALDMKLRRLEDQQIAISDRFHKMYQKTEKSTR